MVDLAGRGILVVGARRVGAVLARRLAREGMRISIGYRSSRPEAEDLARDLQQMTDRVMVVQGDIAREPDAGRMVELAADGLGGLWAVVNLASGYPREPLATLDAAAWDTALGDARGSYLLAVAAARALAANPAPTRGHIVLFTDWAALQTPYRDYLPYLTSKAAIDFLARVLAVEVAPQGILVNAVAPGPVLRPPEITEEEWKRDVLAKTPLRRQSSAEEIAEIVTALIKSETVTGVTVRVDSGRHLAGPGA
jgi:NAD(P)-dependent dehydrogenase (short-subunit alcohol dehydrogenase family)